jgi:hypothetical protein
MSLKYALTENGNIKISNGHPVVIDEDDGEEIELDAIGLYAKVPQLQNEAKKRRLELKDVKKQLEAYEGLGIEDTENFGEWKENAEKALETIENIDQSKLIDAGKVEEIKQAVKDEMAAKIEKIKKQAQDAEKEFKTSLTEKDGTIRKLMVDDQFNTSKYIGEELILTPKMARKIFGDNFRVEKTDDGNAVTVGYLGDDPIMSKKKIGDYARFDEALQYMIDNDPDSDSYKRAVDPKANENGSSQFKRFQQNQPGPGEKMSSIDKIKQGLIDRGKA